MKKNQNNFRGCLIGGAIGDALGWPVEFMKYDEIIRRYGKGGIEDLIISSSGKAEITDDTQMTLFTAEAILRARTRWNIKGICHEPSVAFYSYQRWLFTQGVPKEKEFDWIYDGWLIGIKELHVKRAPGNACLSSLSSRKHGTMSEPINDSKGCGGVMRMSPVGLFYQKEQAFKMGAKFAAITHGHPSGYLSAGALAFLISLIIEGQDIELAVNETLVELGKYKNHQECTQSLDKAIALSKIEQSDIDAISQIGEGWVGEEALAISVYCALKYSDDFKKALIAAVNHDGDSDSTGAITGNIMGAYLGVSQIESEWIENVELKDTLIRIADDLIIEYNKDDINWERYPGY